MSRTLAGSLYWNPVPHIGAVISSLPQHGLRPAPDSIFGGKWAERNWRNVPGPFYGAMTDNCWVGRLHAPRHILYGDDIGYEQEFLYRQPKSIQELRDVIAGMQEDPWTGWASDGDAFWTPELVREWWRNRLGLREWITLKRQAWRESAHSDAHEAATGLSDYLGYIDTELANDLGVYMYFLDHGTSPDAADRLPLL